MPNFSDYSPSTFSNKFDHIENHIAHRWIGIFSVRNGLFDMNCFFFFVYKFKWCEQSVYNRMLSIHFVIEIIPGTFSKFDLICWQIRQFANFPNLIADWWLVSFGICLTQSNKCRSAKLFVFFCLSFYRIGKGYHCVGSGRPINWMLLNEKFNCWNVTTLIWSITKYFIVRLKRSTYNLFLIQTFYHFVLFTIRFVHGYTAGIASEKELLI